LSTTIVIDTNLLLVVLADEHLESTGTTGPARFSRLRDAWGQGHSLPDERFKDLQQVFRQAARRIVTQHVIAEVYNLRGRSTIQDRNILTDLLAGVDLAERSCAFAELYKSAAYRKMLGDVGVTDAGLIYVAEREKATILSEDRDLSSWAHARSVPCFNLQSVDYLVKTPSVH
jgi:rRNA-processing protein FCF1